MIITSKFVKSQSNSDWIIGKYIIYSNKCMISIRMSIESRWNECWTNEHKHVILIEETNERRIQEWKTTTRICRRIL